MSLLFFISSFLIGAEKGQKSAKGASHSSELNQTKNNLLYKTKKTIMSSAHTENLPADLNEHNEELADGCDNADTYLSAFYLCSFFLSLFSAL